MYSVKIEKGRVVSVSVGAILDGHTEISESDYLRYQESKVGSKFAIVDGKLAISFDKNEEIATAKTAKMVEINQQSQAFINAATGAADTPAFEVQTWAIQSVEAKSWHADNNAPTPMLSIIATQRGIPVDVLRAKAYVKAIAYEQIVAVVAGQRQKYEQQIEAAETLAEIQAIEVVYSAGN